MLGKQISNWLRINLLKYFGTNHSLYHFFVLFAILVFGVFTGATVLSVGSQEKIDVFFIQNQFIDMVKETREEEQRDIFIENSSHNVEIVRQSTGDLFYENFVTKSKPVIVSGVANKWMAYFKWTDDHLKYMSFGNTFLTQSKKMNMFSRHFIVPYSVLQTSTLADYIASYRSTKRSTNSVLKGVINLKEYGKDIPNDLPFVNELFKNQVSLMMGPGGHISNLASSNEETFISQLVGCRKFMLFDPLQTPILYPKTDLPLESQVDITNPNLSDFPNFALARAVTGKLNPGEILYIPANWWYFDVAQEGRNLAVEYSYQTHSLTYSKVMDALRSSLKEKLEVIHNKQT